MEALVAATVEGVVLSNPFRNERGKDGGPGLGLSNLA
jgi:hypothetical protein